jgi:hypothetical protein
MRYTLRRMLRRHLAFGLLFLLPLTAIVQCSTGEVAMNDAGGDTGPQNDSSLSDAAKDSGRDAGMDVVFMPDVTTDATDDVTSDAIDDVTADAPPDSPGADAADGGWTVTSISNLVLWLDANKGVTTTGSSITAWADQSGQANNASGGTDTPTLVSSSINSLPAAHFVASSLQYVSVADATSLQFGTGDFTIAVVAKFDNDPTNGITSGIGALYSKLGTGSGLLFFANNYDYGAMTFAAGLCELEDPTPTEVAYSATYNDSTARLYLVQRASGTEVLRVNGSQVATSTSSIDLSEVGAEVDIGLLGASSEAALDGDIAEVIAVGGTLSSSDLTSLESYLKTKYGL